MAKEDQEQIIKNPKDKNLKCGVLNTYQGVSNEKG